MLFTKEVFLTNILRFLFSNEIVKLKVLNCVPKKLNLTVHIIHQAQKIFKRQKFPFLIKYLLYGFCYLHLLTADLEAWCMTSIE